MRVISGKVKHVSVKESDFSFADGEEIAARREEVHPFKSFSDKSRLVKEEERERESSNNVQDSGVNPHPLKFKLVNVLQIGKQEMSVCTISKFKLLYERFKWVKAQERRIRPTAIIPGRFKLIDPIPRSATLL